MSSLNINWDAFTALLTLATAAIAFWAVTIARRELSNWKDQIKGQAKHDVARDHLFEVYELQTIITSSRLPERSIQEVDAHAEITRDARSRGRVYPGDPVLNPDDNKFKYRIRLIDNSVNQLQLASIKSKAVINSSQLNDYSADLVNHANKLVARMQSFISTPLNEESDVEKRMEAQAFIELPKNEVDEYSNTTDDLVKNIENILLPIIK